MLGFRRLQIHDERMGVILLSQRIILGHSLSALQSCFSAKVVDCKLSQVTGTARKLLRTEGGRDGEQQQSKPDTRSGLGGAVPKCPRFKTSYAIGQRVASDHTSDHLELESFV